MLRQLNPSILKKLVLNAQKMIVIYFLSSIFLSIVWNSVVTELAMDLKTISLISTVTSCIYLTITAILFSLFLKHYTFSIRHAENELQEDHLRLVDVNQDLLKMETQLRQQLSESLQQQKRMKDQNEYLLALLSAMPDMIFHFDKHGVFIDYKGNQEAHLRENRINPLLGRSIFDLLPPPLAKDTKEIIATVLETSELQIIEYCLPIDQEEQYWEARLAKVNDNEILAMVRDTTQRSQLLKELHYVSQHDHLTGLYNRAHFEQQMEQLNGKKHVPITVFICDLDGLKTINDSLGHQFGDQLLKAAALTLSRAFRKNDIIARIGGDEFAILLPKTSMREAKIAYERIRASEILYNQENLDLPLGISIGFAVSDEHAANMKELFVEADNNMYKEKKSRK